VRRERASPTADITEGIVGELGIGGVDVDFDGSRMIWRCAALHRGRGRRGSTDLNIWGACSRPVSCDA
jgi:hypothetical protein